MSVICIVWKCHFQHWVFIQDKIGTAFHTSNHRMNLPTRCLENVFAAPPMRWHLVLNIFVAYSWSFRRTWSNEPSHEVFWALFDSAPMTAAAVFGTTYFYCIFEIYSNAIKMFSTKCHHLSRCTKATNHTIPFVRLFNPNIRDFTPCHISQQRLCQHISYLSMPMRNITILMTFICVSSFVVSSFSCIT